MMRSRIIILCILINLFARCVVDKKSKSFSDKNFTTIIYRFDEDFIMYKFDRLGVGKASAGKASFYVDAFLIKSVDDSVDIMINSAELYFSKLQIFKKKPFVGDFMRDSPRVEIYNENDKVFDSYRFNSSFWDLIKIIHVDIPERYNPFLHSNKN